MHQETWVQRQACKPAHHFRNSFLFSPVGNGKTLMSYLPVSSCSHCLWSFSRDPSLYFCFPELMLKVSLLTSYLCVLSVCPQLLRKVTKEHMIRNQKWEWQRQKEACIISWPLLVQIYGLSHSALKSPEEHWRALPQRRKADIIWWLSTTKKCWQIINLL